MREERQSAVNALTQPYVSEGTGMPNKRVEATRRRTRLTRRFRRQDRNSV